MTNLQFPTRSQLLVLCAWLSEGPAALDSPKLYAQEKRPRRNHSLRQLRGLAPRLELGREYERMWTRGEHGAPLAEILDPKLRDEMYRRSRRCGYLLRDGTGVPPLNAYRMHALHLLSWGHTYESAAEVMSTTRNALWRAMSESKKECGCATLAELTGCSFRNEWLPTHKELLALSPTRSHGEVVASLAGRAAA